MMFPTRLVSQCFVAFVLLGCTWMWGACSGNITPVGDGQSQQDGHKHVHDGGHHQKDTGHHQQQDTGGGLPDLGVGPLPDQKTSNDTNNQTPDQGTTTDNGSGTPDQSSNTEQGGTNDGPQAGGDKGPKEQGAPEKPQTPDNGIVVDNASPFAPKGSELGPALLNIATFWRFMPGSVYRPIVVQGTITIVNRSKALITNLKLDAQLYLPFGAKSKYIELTPSNGPLPTSIPAGYSKNIAFDGAEADHGLPKYQKPVDICGKIYVPVVRFKYKAGGVDKEFRMYWRRVPFGCNCFGTHQCP